MECLVMEGLPEKLYNTDFLRCIFQNKELLTYYIILNYYVLLLLLFNSSSEFLFIISKEYICS